MGSAPQDVVALDLDHDGKVDIVSANNASTDLTVALGNGDGTFLTPDCTVDPLPAGCVSVGFGPHSIATGLINSDTKVDLAVANEDSDNVSVLLGTGSATLLGTADNIETGMSPETVVLEDFNGDHKLDMATADYFDDTVTIQIGVGDGTFSNAHSVSLPPMSSPTGLAVGDVTGDGQLDLVVSLNLNNTVVVLEGDGQGNFTVGATLNVGPSPAGVAIADLDHDNDMDIIVANEEFDSVSVLLNSGNGTFAAAFNLDTGPATYPEAVRIADLNGDHHPDIVVTISAADQVAIFRGKGDGSFEAADFVPTDFTPTGLFVGDVNADCSADILTANLDGDSVSVLLNQSGGGCTGDCDCGGVVTINELVQGVNIALGVAPLGSCRVLDKNIDGKVTVDELVGAVNHALTGCAS